MSKGKKPFTSSEYRHQIIDDLTAYARHFMYENKFSAPGVWQRACGLSMDRRA